MINIYHDFDCEVNVDKDKIGQVIINFVSNAIKYSPDNDVINVRIVRAEGDHVSVRVEDFGIGIDREEHQKIFQRFYRIEGKNEKHFSGFGIGLFIAHSIVEEHNGYITIESEKGKGSVFTFTLPGASE